MGLVPHNVRAVVFDAYGTLFDVSSAAEQARDELGESWQAISGLWRVKQLQYTWLRTLMACHADFWQVTGDALDFALESFGVSDAALRSRLMLLYERLGAYPDAQDALARLRTAGFRTAILSNGSPRMLAAAVENARLAELLDMVLSVEEAGQYKPHPSVYRLAEQRLELDASKILFVSANGWDASGAKTFGMQVVWCNRGGQPAERLPSAPDIVVSSLAALSSLLGSPRTRPAVT